MCGSLDNDPIDWVDTLSAPDTLTLPAFSGTGFSVVSEYRGCVLGGIASDT